MRLHVAPDSDWADQYPVDLCLRCWPFRNEVIEDGADVDDENPHEHPLYGDAEYDCEICGCHLTDDNG